MNELKNKINELESGKISSKDFATFVFKNNISKESLEYIVQRTSNLDEEIKNAVYNHSDDLLQNATDVKILRDKVLLLKTQINSTRLEAQHITMNVIDPYNKIVNSATNLQNIHIASKVLRTLIKFFSLAKQLEKSPQILSINGITNDIRRYCELYTISEDKYLSQTNIFKVYWKDFEPKCLNMINIAKQKLSNGILKYDANEIQTSVAVFDFLYKLNEIYDQMLNTIADNIRNTHEQQLRTCKGDQVLSILMDDISLIPNYVKQVTMLQYAVQMRLKSDSTKKFDGDLSSNKGLTLYFEVLKETLEKVSKRMPKVSSELADQIPSFRKHIIQNLLKLPSSFDINESILIMSQVIQPYQNEYTKNIVARFRKKLDGIVTGSGKLMNKVTIKEINNEFITEFAGFDGYLVRDFQNIITDLASYFCKLKNHPNQSFRIEANKISSEFQNTLVELSNKYYSEDFTKTINNMFT